MDQFFPNPISNDGVDKLNYKYMVLLLFTLSVIGYVIPLQSMKQEQSFLVSYMDPIRIPQVKAACISPIFRADHKIVYANIYCQNAFNGAMQGGSVEQVAAISKNGVLSTLKTHVDYVQQIIQEHKDQISILQEYTSMRASIQRLVTFETPTTILGIAISLTIPQFIWAFLSEFFYQGDIGQTLDFLDKDAMQNMVVQKRGIDMSSNVASRLYLFKKFMSCVVVILLVGLIGITTRHRAESLNQNITNSEPGLQKSNGNGTQVRIADPDQWIDLAGVFRSPNDTFYCQLYTLRNSNKSGLSRQQLQCTIYEVEPVQHTIQSLSDSLLNQRNIMEFEMNLLNVVTVILIVLSVINVINFATWFCALACITPRQSAGLKSNTAMDMLLMFQLAAINAGPGTVDHIAQLINDDFSNFRFSDNFETVDERVAGEDNCAGASEAEK